MGDQWNGEDLSIVSLDDQILPISAVPSPSPLGESTTSLVDKKVKDNQISDAAVNPGNLRAAMRTPSIASHRSDAPAEITNSPGYRAAEAYVRPSPIATAGTILQSGFDLRNGVFTFKLTATQPAPENAPTEIFLPEFHFPKDKCTVQTSSGKWTISTDESGGGGALVQILRWWHADGEQSLKVTGVKRAQQLTRQDEEGYLDQCQNTTNKCAVM
jgi:hypothetical protein